MYDDLGPGASIAICDYNHGNPGLAGGGMLANEFIRLPYQFMGHGAARGCRAGGEAHKEFVRSAYRRTISIRGRCRRCRCSIRACRWTPR